MASGDPMAAFSSGMAGEGGGGAPAPAEKGQGGESTGFMQDGPKNCANCTENQGGICRNAEVAADPAVPKERIKDGGVDINPADKTYCDTEFKSKGAAPAQPQPEAPGAGGGDDAASQYAAGLGGA
jgi:hypothetical protein